MSYIGNQPLYTSYITDSFSGNGSTLAYTLSIAPANSASLLVAIFGVLQDPSAYGVVGTTLTFTSAPPAGTNNISVRYLGLPASNVVTSAYRTVTDIIATAGQTTFSPASYTPEYIDVYRNGAKLGTTDYTATNGAQVVLNNAAALGDIIQIVSFSVGSVLNAIPANGGVITAGYLDVASKTGSGAMSVPAGITSQRPAGPVAGMLRFNSTIGLAEIYTGSEWRSVGNVTGKEIFTYTGNTNQTWAVPSGATQARVKVWGAGGSPAGGATNKTGGAGGYVEGIINLLGISTLVIVVGEGGRYNGGTSLFYGGCGGGYSGIFNGSVSQATALAIAGGGGGAGDGGGTEHGWGGAGGGLVGGDGQDDTRLASDTGGFGGTQSAGGARGVDSYGSAQNSAGSALQGGQGAGATVGGGVTQGTNLWTTVSYGGGGPGGINNSGVGNWVGGGGGGGYFGGGGGNQGYSGGGGGGSSYVGAMLSVVYNLQGSTGANSGTVNPPRTTDGDYIAGVGTSSIGATGGNGRVILEYF